MSTRKERAAAHAPYDDESETVTVTMDIGVYRYLTEWLDAKHEQRRYFTVVPWYDALMERGHRQFQAAAAKPEEEVSANGSTPRKRVIRRVAKGRKRR